MYLDPAQATLALTYRNLIRAARGCSGEGPGLSLPDRCVLSLVCASLGHLLVCQYGWPCRRLLICLSFDVSVGLLVCFPACLSCLVCLSVHPSESLLLSVKSVPLSSDRGGCGYHNVLVDISTLSPLPPPPLSFLPSLVLTCSFRDSKLKAPGFCLASAHASGREVRVPSANYLPRASATPASSSRSDSAFARRPMCRMRLRILEQRITKID